MAGLDMTGSNERSESLEAGRSELPGLFWILRKGLPLIRLIGRIGPIE